MANISEYERGYKDGAKDCQALHGRILDRICVALDEKGEKEQAKKQGKYLLAKRKKIACFETEEKQRQVC